MKTSIFSIALVICISACSQQQVQQAIESIEQVANGQNGALTDSDVTAGLKEALRIGAENSALNASALDGFWKNDLIKIPFPEEAIKVKNTLTDIGLGAQVEQFEMTLNRAAEDAAKEAAPIFVNAITNMSIEDAFGVLNGGDHSATDYLRAKTTGQLEEKFTPVVDASIEKVELTKYWEPLATKYNTVTTLTGGEPVQADLTEYVNEKALDGLFLLVAQEEAKIRHDPAARVTDLLQRVFAGQE